MKRYVLFYGPIGRASAGWVHSASDHDTVDEAMAEARAQRGTST
jgi:hypothetical protein